MTAADPDDRLFLSVRRICTSVQYFLSMEPCLRSMDRPENPAFLRGAIASVYGRTCAPQVGEQKSARLTATESSSNLEQKDGSKKFDLHLLKSSATLPLVLECQACPILLSFAT
jgi:hypothetical protein